MARARNQPRSALGWALCLILLFLTVFLFSLRVAEAATHASDHAMFGAARDAADAGVGAPELADLAGVDPLDPLDPLDSLYPLDPLDLEELDPADRELLAQVGSWLEPERPPASERAPSWLGRVELSLTWRRATRWDAPLASGIDAVTVSSPPATRTELWLIARWR